MKHVTRAYEKRGFVSLTLFLFRVYTVMTFYICIISTFRSGQWLHFTPYSGKSSIYTKETSILVLIGSCLVFKIMEDLDVITHLRGSRVRRDKISTVYTLLLQVTVPAFTAIHLGSYTSMLHMESLSQVPSYCFNTTS